MRAKLAVVGVLLALVGAGFYWYSQRGTKLSETDTILIGDFANATGDPVFDGTLREALTVSLAQSPLLNLISVEKVSEALRALGRPIDTPITRDLAPRLCQRLGATVYLAGSIAKDGSGYALKLDATQCTTGHAVSSANSDARNKGEGARGESRRLAAQGGARRRSRTGRPCTRRARTACRPPKCRRQPPH